jgi:hypothetical protein
MTRLDTRAMPNGEKKPRTPKILYVFTCSLARLVLQALPDALFAAFPGVARCRQYTRGAGIV